MFRAKLTIGSAIDRIRSIPDLAANKFRERLGVAVSEELRQRVLDIMAEDPGPPSSPFEFGSDRSQRFYFALITQFPELTDGAHWTRTGDLENSWTTEVSIGGLSGSITVFSTRPDATYVYGPWAVPGHIVTGWPDKFDRARRLIMAEAKHTAFDTWDSSVYEAAAEAGFLPRRQS